VKDPAVRDLFLRGLNLFSGNIEFLNQMADFMRQAGEIELVEKAWRQSLRASPSQDWLYRAFAIS